MFLRQFKATRVSVQRRYKVSREHSGVLSRQGSCSSAMQWRSDIYSTAMETVQSSTGGQGSLWRVDRWVRWGAWRTEELRGIKKKRREQKKRKNMSEIGFWLRKIELGKSLCLWMKRMRKMQCNNVRKETDTDKEKILSMCSLSIKTKNRMFN